MPSARAGNIISNVLDYTKWIKAMIDSSRPISAAGHQAVISSRILINKDDESFTGVESYTLGWFKWVYRGEEYVSHSSVMEGYVTLVYYFPRLKYGLVTFANTDYNSEPAEMSLLFYLIDEKFGIPKHDRFNFAKQ